MSLFQSLKNVWRKNVPELAGLFNGSLPDFVVALRPREPLGGVPIFSFHVVDAGLFEADLRFLSENGYYTVTCSELIAFMAGEHELPPRSVMLTFDDGPSNLFRVAFPLLVRYKLRATAFVAPGLHADAQPADPSVDRPLTWQEIETMHASGLIDFQSHTFESRYVPRWPLPAALSGVDPAIENARRGDPLPFGADLAKSREVLESRIPALKIDQLAFPMYLGTPEAVQAARELEFRACFWGLTPGQPINRRGDSPFHISRLSDEFVRRLPGKGRATYAQMLRERIRRIREGREWRRRFPEPLV